MLLSINVSDKTLGNKQLFSDLQFSVEAGQKIAIIGRNGVGKTTLFGMLTGEDTDFTGSILRGPKTRIVSTAQEHHDIGDQSVLNYIVQRLPDYARLKHIIDTYPDTMGENMGKIQTYTNALTHFSSLGYYTIEDAIVRTLENYQITTDMALGPLKNLSGGQKRFVELARVEHAAADLALIDEPTNHMDYAAKAAFIDWLQGVQYSVVVISHDRDVLQCVDKIIEIIDGKARVFKGNYQAYLKQNTTATTAAMHDYEVNLQTLANLQKQILYARARKPGWSGKGEKNPYEVMERRLQKQYDALEATTIKPSFWIDRESADSLKPKTQDTYQKYKAKNIKLHKNDVSEQSRELLHVEDVQLSYGQTPLFTAVNLRLQHGERAQLVGRNGAGKTTLVKAIMAAANGKKPATLCGGKITCSPKLRLSVYEQEVGPELLSLPLAGAIEHIYDQFGVATTPQTRMRIMSDYLFDPIDDARLLVSDLSGGQKARLQLIKLLANNPNMLILDEPTNHLDLPSIEELEHALANYHGALLYVSHDSYFAKNMGGEQLQIKAQ